MANTIETVQVELGAKNLREALVKLCQQLEQKMSSDPGWVQDADMIRVLRKLLDSYG